MAEISVIIPARNEHYLTRTVSDLFYATSTDIEVFVLLDGWDIKEPTKKHSSISIDRMKHEIETIKFMASKDKRIRIMQKDKPVGQRAFMNEAAKLMRSKYMFKLDAHCIVYPGWDTELLKVADPRRFITTSMRNIKDDSWIAGDRHFDYCYIDEHLRSRWWTEYRNRVDGNKDLVETMSFYGTTWFCHKDFWKKHGGYWSGVFGWGDSGTEWALKTWLCGDTLLLHRGVVVAHLYRDKFPYGMENHARIQMARVIRGAFYRNEYPLQKHPIEWLLGKFWPVPTWSKTLVDQEHREKKYFVK